jgi:plastocyanin
MRKVLAAVLVTLALASCSSSDGTGTSVSMSEGQRFEPAELTTTVGSTVTWTNDSSESHTVTAYDTAEVYFASGGATSEDEARDAVADGLLDDGETFEFTFEEPGTYQYFCIPHEDQGMVGTIIVEE